MGLHATRLRQLAREAQLCASLCPQIGRINSAKGGHGKDGVLSMVIRSGQSRRALLFASVEDLRTLSPVDFGINSTYLHAHMPKINSSSVKICESSQKVLAQFSPTSCPEILNCYRRRSIWLTLAHIPRAFLIWLCTALISSSSCDKILPRYPNIATFSSTSPSM